MTETPLKTCTKCKCEKPATTDYFELRYKKLHSNCKDCLKERKKEYSQRPEVKEKKNERQREYRKRPDYKKKYTEYKKAYYQRPDVKERCSEYHKDYRKRPGIKERYNEKLKEYRKRPGVKEKIKNSQKKHRKKIVNQLHTRYVIRKMGLKKDEIPPEMIETKRLTIALKRELKKK
jgi:hypothetical protein